MHPANVSSLCLAQPTIEVSVVATSRSDAGLRAIESFFHHAYDRVLTPRNSYTSVHGAESAGGLRRRTLDGPELRPPSRVAVGVCVPERRTPHRTRKSGPIRFGSQLFAIRVSLMKGGARVSVRLGLRQGARLMCASVPTAHLPSRAADKKTHQRVTHPQSQRSARPTAVCAGAADKETTTTAAATGSSPPREPPRHPP